MVLFVEQFCASLIPGLSNRLTTGDDSPQYLLLRVFGHSSSAAVVLPCCLHSEKRRSAR